ncbi:MAG: hypothetical protein DI570_09295 [Phenylobacterium zucineum]|nr:MAG: hypothetical protein DI570_09295 [Phenylobacterium zucineum]
MRHPCKLFRAGVETVEAFDAVAYLADRIHTLRAFRPIITMSARLTTHDFAGECVVIRYDDDSGDALGFVVIGEPEYPARRQDELLCGALFRLDPGRPNRMAA